MSSKWTTQTIYREHVEGELAKFMNPFPPCFTPAALGMIKAGTRIDLPWTKGFLDAFRSEELWVEDGDPKEFIAEEMPGVVRKKKKCSTCLDLGYYWRAHTGQTTHIQAMFQEDCECRFYHLVWILWGDTNTVPEPYRNVTLDDLTPSPRSNLSDPAQQKVINLLQSCRDYSFLMYGDTGTGKTHFSIALLQHAVHEWARKICNNAPDATSERTVFRIDAKAWCDAMLEFSRRSFDDNVKLPDLTVTRVRKMAEHEPPIRLFVIFDEIDKVPPSEGRLLNLFQLCNALSECGAQIVATSNHSPEQLVAKWDSEHTGPILRRICDRKKDEKRMRLPLTAIVETTDKTKDNPEDKK
jgi:hypothetical protein